MSKIFFFILGALLLASGAVFTWKLLETSEKENITRGGTTTLQVLNESIHLGTFPFAEQREGVFKMINAGKKPLIILEATTSCNCTEVTWPREPIAPGDTARIHITYTPNARGRFAKTIDLYCNTVPPVTILRFDGSIE
ncbi:MAG: DUF1573 domain-containing protein [Odoribacteraceae bacterium]|jgi:hypothetical protein|nr:DUF1573 domain-containing protein [Odoribacteraceae bacterium]